MSGRIAGNLSTKIDIIKTNWGVCQLAEDFEEFAETLVDKNIITRTIYERAREAYLVSKINEILSPHRAQSQGFIQFIVEIPDVDTDRVYHEVAKYYGFRELEIPIEQIPKSELEWMKEKFNSFHFSIRQKMIEEGIFLYKTEKILSRTRYNFYAINPTSRQISKICFAIAPESNVGFDITVIKEKEFNKLLLIINP